HRSYLTHTATAEFYTLSLHDALPISQLPVATAGAADAAQYLGGRSNAAIFCQHAGGDHHRSGRLYAATGAGLVTAGTGKSDHATVGTGRSPATAGGRQQQ